MAAHARVQQRHVGPNFEQLPVNQPVTEVHNYNKDGPMRVHHNGGQPVYAPNSYGGPRADPRRYPDLGWQVEAGEIMRTAYEAHRDDDDFVQPGTLYREVMSATEREHLVSNVAAHLGDGVERFIQERAVNEYWAKVDPELGALLARDLGLMAPVR